MTPTATAAAIGNSSVDRNVTDIAILPVMLVRHTTRMFIGFIDISAAKISTADRYGIATTETTPPRASRMTSIHRPAKIVDHRLRAPAARLIAVVLTEPPTGTPCTSADARLPTPCPMRSRFVDDGVPSGLGADSATPAPCTRMIAAIAAAPESRLTLSRSYQVGRTSGGRPDGMVPTSATVRTSSHP